MKNNGCKKGFTLIELLVVVLIIGILEAIALPQYQKAVEKSRLAEALTNISTMREQMEMYLLENGGYPPGLMLYKNFTSVDIPGSEVGAQDMYETWQSKFFEYRAYCTSGSCTIPVRRRNEGANGSGLYGLNCNRSSSTEHKWRCICSTFYTNVGRTICKGLESQGFEYWEGSWEK